MAVLNFLFGTRSAQGFSLSGIVEIQADLTLREAHERTNEVTTNPVESGAVISDHVIRNPERVTLEGFVTDTPAALFAADAGRTQDAFELLSEAAESGEPVQIVTARETYEDMVLTRVELPYDRPASMSFTIEAQHVRIVDSEFGDLPETADTEEGEAAGNMAAPEQDQGRQSTREAGESTSERSSFVYDFFYGED